MESTSSRRLESLGAGLGSGADFVEGLALGVAGFDVGGFVADEFAQGGGVAGVAVML